MDKFVTVKRKEDDASRDDQMSPQPEKAPKLDIKPIFGPKPQTASVKTIKKWEKELAISLEFETSSDGNLVTKIWCKVCRYHSHDKTSSVS